MLRQALAAAGAAAVTLTACHSQAAHPHASALATSTAVKADENAAAELVKPCIPASQAVLLTRSGRQSFTACMKIAPARRPAFESCVMTAAEHDLHPVAAKAAREAGEQAFTQGAAGCAEQAR